MSTTKKRLLLVLTIAVLLIATGIWLNTEMNSVPILARRLPVADGYLYVDLRPVRLVLNTKGDSLPTIQREAEYDAFVKQTGFEFERDLEQAAIAVHGYEPTKNENGTVELQRRYSEFFAGKIDTEKIAAWLLAHSASTEKFAGHDIYSIPFEGRKVRVVVLDNNTVAISNTTDPAPIHTMVEAADKSQFSLEGPTLLKENMQYVPFGSALWLLGNFQSPDKKSPILPLPGGVDLALPQGTVTVTSIGVSTQNAGSVEFKLQAITRNEQDARALTETAGTFLNLFRSASANVGGSDPDVKKFFDSVQVIQEGSHTVFLAQAPLGFLKKAISGPAQSTQPSPTTKPIQDIKSKNDVEKKK